MAAIPVTFMQRCALHARDAMRALKALRERNLLCSPSAVKELMGVQKRHRMAYAGLTAQLLQARQQELSAEAAKAAQVLATRRSQTKAGLVLVERGEQQAGRKKRKANYQRYGEGCKKRQQITD